jgi:UDPglucose 6-dehydrogenase
MSEDVSVVGLGKLGLCLAAVLADAGFRTVGVDIDEAVVRAVNSGESPIIEPGLAELVARHGGKSLVATTRHAEAVERSDITFIVVATPSHADGNFSNRYVEAALSSLSQSLAAHGKPFHTFVVGCTVMPGSTDNIFVPLVEKHSGRKLNEGFGICYDPEFVALGSVIRNFREPDLVIIGESSPAAGDRVDEVHRKLCRNQPRIFRMSITSAEIAKVSLNVFLTMKISFGNMLAGLCEKIPGADVDQITAAIGTDRRIAPHYLRGGLAFGGPCFPRDTRAFLALARRHDCDADLVQATDAINERQALHLLDRVLAATGGNPKTRVAVLGLAFKSDTPVTTESPAIRLIKELLERDYPVVAYDPLAVPQAKALFGDRIEYAGSASECIRVANVCVLANQDAEYRSAVEAYRGGQEKTLIDCWRILRQEKLARSVDCLAVGRASEGRRTGQRGFERVNILGVGVSAVNMGMALAQIERWIDRREPNYVVAAPAHGLMDCQRDEKLRGVYNRAGMVIPDGMPVAWICRMLGGKHVARVCGPDLMASLCERSVARGYKHFLYGGWPPDVVEKLSAQLRRRFPGIQVVGTHAPPFRPPTPEEDAEIVAKINAAAPDIVWIGLGTSKEKFWAASHLEKLAAPVLVGVGAAFDFHAGRVRQAPRWMQRSGLEWFFRLCCEPRRLWRRYLKNNPRFLLRIFCQLARLKKYALE